MVFRHFWISNLWTRACGPVSPSQADVRNKPHPPEVCGISSPPQEKFASAALIRPSRIWYKRGCFFGNEVVLWGEKQACGWPHEAFVLGVDGKRERRVVGSRGFALPPPQGPTGFLEAGYKPPTRCHPSGSAAFNTPKKGPVSLEVPQESREVWQRRR